MKRIFHLFIAQCLILIFISQSTFSQDTKQFMTFNGYTQLRFTENFNDINSFSLRRLKFWVKSSPDFSKHWAYKIKTTLSSNKDEKFVLQDVKIIYKTGNFKINIGQIVPEFSLQRFQPDYRMPLTERAPVVNALIPNGSLGDWDIGVETYYNSKNKMLETWAGVFNGYGIKEYKFKNSGLLLTHKTAIHFFNNHFQTGYSIMYRKADNLEISKLLPASIIYSGDDFRYNLFAQYQTKKINVQAEYFYAKLENYKAKGYYVLSSINFNKSQAVVSYNKYEDTIDTTCDDPIIHLGYNYLINKNKLKMMLDNSFQLSDGNVKNYSVSIQLQIFF